MKFFPKTSLAKLNTDSKSDAKIAKAMIEAGVDVDAKDNFGGTALYFAVVCNDLEIGKMLIEANAGLNVKCGWKPNALELAVDINHGEFAEMLRKQEANN
jgi:ankyrin repeat protein